MKILLHIGQSKTGTSAIQSFLLLNREKLLKAGYLYPNVRLGNFTVNIANHNAVADSLTNRLQYPFLSPDQYFKQFFSQAKESNAKCMIISAEHFIGGEPRVWNVPDQKTYYKLYRQKIQKLAKYLKGHDVSILTYLRPQVDWLSSTIAQTIRIEKIVNNKRIYHNDEQFFEMVKPMLNYNRMLDIWNETLAPTEITAVPYARDILYKRSSIADFLNRASINQLEYDPSMEQMEVNTSLTREYIEVKKHLNIKGKSINQERVIVSCLERLSRKSCYETTYKLDEKVVSKVISQAETENNKLNARYIKDAFPLTSISSYKGGEMSALTASEIDIAMDRFKIEYLKPRTRLMAARYRTLELLRNHARPVHAALHQLKQLHSKLFSRQT